MNPNLKYAETVRGKSNVYPAGIMVGRNLTDVIDAIGLIQDSSAWTKEIRQVLYHGSPNTLVGL